MGVESLVNDSRFIDILNKYSEEDKIGNIFLAIMENRKSKEIIIPVLGMQGMGKSTLINSILSENILPNDADETTCVPVEVKYGEEEKAVVNFKDSNNVVEIFTRQELNQYVDNIYNPGNEKKVSHIVLYRALEILKSGVTLVDLPGVGSLTKENQETTMRYIKNLCTAIFVIPTIPTIRRSEELFIKSVWMQFTSAIFVQNNFGETKREVQESIEFNSMVLKNIARAINTPYNGQITVVNAYNAIYGELHNDSEMVKNSNINSLIADLKNTVLNWNENEIENVKSKVKLIIDSCKKQMNQLLEESVMSESELQKKLEAEEESFRVNTKKLQKHVKDIEEFLEEKEEEVYSFAKDAAKICTENIRSDVFRLIDSGVVDGEMLTEAFNNFQNQYIAEVVNNFYDLKEKIIAELLDIMEEIGEIIKAESEISMAALNFNNGEAFKFEKGLEVGIDLAGGFGAIYVGAKVGSLVGTTFGGPIGFAVGALAGAAVGIVSSIFANKTKKAITNTRGRETKRQIEIVIDEIGEIIKKQIDGTFKDISEVINLSLDKYIDKRKKQFQEIKDKNIEKSNLEFKGKYDLQELREDYKYLISRETEIDG